MDLPVSPDRLVPLALQAVQQLPKLRRRKPAPDGLRQAAYSCYLEAAWNAVTAYNHVHTIAPFATKKLSGVWWHRMLTHGLEEASSATAAMAGALDQLRLVAPTSVRLRAEDVVTHIEGLASTISGPADAHQEHQEHVGQALRDLVVACRIDLRYDRDPASPTVSRWNPATWIRWVRWWWASSR